MEGKGGRKGRERRRAGRMHGGDERVATVNNETKSEKEEEGERKV